MNYRSLFDWDEPDAEREIHVRQESHVNLRPYQGEAVDSVFAAWNSGDQATLVCLPTGTGKSIVFSEVMRQWVERN